MNVERANRARVRSARVRVAAAFMLTTLASVAFVGAYLADAGAQWEGLTLGLAFIGLAFGLTIWARQLLPNKDETEEHPSFSSPPEEQDLLADEIVDTGATPRRGLLGLLGLAASALGIAALVPAYSLAQPFGVRTGSLRRTAWRAGVRLVDSAGRPIRSEEITLATIVSVFPEGHTNDGDAPAFAVRLPPEDIVKRPPGPDLGGLVVYSMLCTHAGCPVTLYQQGTGRMLCPCHQSVFDLRRGALPVSGPADRPLAGLPVESGEDGYLYAIGDFTSPPGPGHWSYP